MEYVEIKDLKKRDWVADSDGEYLVDEDAVFRDDVWSVMTVGMDDVETIFFEGAKVWRIESWLKRYLESQKK